MSSPTGFRVSSDLKPWIKELAKIEGGLQRVTARTITTVAKAAHGATRDNLRRKMIVRNQYTERSLVFYPASEAKPIARQNAVTGTKSPYLPVQETGGRVRGKSGKALAVPTNAVRGSDRRKAIPASKRLNRMGEFGAPGSKYFILRPASPVRRLKRAAIFRRKSKHKLERVRDLGAKEYKLRATYWHSLGVRKYGTYRMYQVAFKREAQRELGRYTKG